MYLSEQADTGKEPTMATTLSLQDIENEFFAGDRSLEDLIIVDAQGYEWAVTSNEYDELFITDEDESHLLANVETFYAPPIVGAMETHGPFTLKG